MNGTVTTTTVTKTKKNTVTKQIEPGSDNEDSEKEPSEWDIKFREALEKAKLIG